MVLGSVVYSAYEDYSAVRPYLSGAQGPIGSAVVQGNSEVVSLNITLPNRGVYALNVTVSCVSPGSNVVCHPASVSVPPGGQGVLRFSLSVVDLQAFASGNHTLNGTVSISLEPFVSLSVGANFGGLVNTGGG